MSSKGRCGDCPVGCEKKEGDKRQNKRSSYARLWGLDPERPDFPQFLSEYHRLTDDLGVDAFEVARTLALARRAGLIPPDDPGALLGWAAEIGQGSDLGRLLGRGAAQVARVWGLPPEPEAGPTKATGLDPEATVLADTLGLCAFAAGALAVTPEAEPASGVRAALAEILAAKYGQTFAPEDWVGLGRRIAQLEAEFNRRAGAAEDEERGEVMSNST